MTPSRLEAERFWSKVSPEPNTGCWLWVGSVSWQGYGRAWLGGRCVLAHRASWAESFGPIPCGLHALHRCDNPPCVNPAHLFLGTNAENVADRDRKGRGARGASVSNRGERNGSHKLTREAVREIRASVGATQDALARRYGVTQAVVWRVLRGISWKEVAQ